MEADAAKPGPIEEGTEAAIEVRGIDRPSRRRCEDEAAALRAFRLRLTFCLLSFTVLLEIYTHRFESLPEF